MSSNRRLTAFRRSVTIYFQVREGRHDNLGVDNPVAHLPPGVEPSASDTSV